MQLKASFWGLSFHYAALGEIPHCHAEHAGDVKHPCAGWVALQTYFAALLMGAGGDGERILQSLGTFTGRRKESAAPRTVVMGGGVPSATAWLHSRFLAGTTATQGLGPQQPWGSSELVCHNPQTPGGFSKLHGDCY